MMDYAKQIIEIQQKHFKKYCERLKRLDMPLSIVDNEIKFKIDSFIEYDTLITKLHELENGDGQNSLFVYRGVTNESYKLRSSLRVNHLQMYEDSLITSMYNSSPSEFVDCKTDFEMIAKMQHYGLPTRFIDFTKNPYIALWFACQEDANRKDANGLVYFDDKAIYSSRDILDIIVKIIMDSAYENDIDFFYKTLTFIERENYLDFLVSSSAKCYFEPPKIDAREINQQSVFLAECNGIDRVHRNENWEITSVDQLLTAENLSQIKLHELYLEETYKSHAALCFGHIIDIERFNNEPLKKIIISNSAKECILKELSYRGITRSFIYPALNNIADEIKCDYLKDCQNFGEDYEQCTF